MAFDYLKNIFANSGDLSTVPPDDDGTSISYAQGFNQNTDIAIADGGLPIDRGQLNTVLNVLFQGFAEIQRCGGLLWRNDTEYTVGSEVMYMVGSQKETDRPPAEEPDPERGEEPLQHGRAGQPGCALLPDRHSPADHDQVHLHPGPG